MSVIIGSARIDENGRATYGRAGDQTGREVATQEWYQHSKGWRVFRPKRPKVAEAVAVAMEHACANDKIGYDQEERFTAYDWCKYENGGNYDPASITVKVETDCSALVRLCLAYAGVFLGDFYTGNEAETLMASGEFIEATSAAGRNPDYLARGDILVTRTTAHTVIVLTNGSKVMAAKKDSEDLLVEVGNMKTYKLRSVTRGEIGPHVRTVQLLLKGMDYKGETGKPLKIDGEAGDNTMFAIANYIADQKAAGVDLGDPNGWGPLCWNSLGWEAV